MKRLLLLSLFLYCSSLAIAQDSLLYKHTFRVQLSAAVPAGEFGKAAFEDEYPDFALTGTMLSVSYARTINKYLAVGSSLHYRNNRFDMDQFVNQNDKLVLEKNSKSWRSLFAMADAYLHSPEGRLGNFFLKGSAGASFNRSADVHVLTTYGPVALPADNAAALAWGFGAGTQLFFNEWALVLDVSRFYTSPVFQGKAAAGNSIEYKQPMGSLNYGIAVSYSF